jgi:hypothetical protein
MNKAQALDLLRRDVQRATINALKASATSEEILGSIGCAIDAAAQIDQTRLKRENTTAIRRSGLVKPKGVAA